LPHAARGIDLEPDRLPISAVRRYESICNSIVIRCAASKTTGGG